MEQYLSKKKINEKKWILEFVPKDLTFLIDNKKIEYKQKNLKCAYLTHLLNYMICKYYHTDKKEVSLSSEVLRKWYGTYYNYYLDFLIDNDILIKDKSYFVGMKCNTYVLNERYYDKGINIFTRYKNDNSFILKKWKEKQLEFEIQSLNDTRIINPWVKRRLIDDLYHVEIDFNGASECLLEMYNNGKLDSDKSYLKNLLSIESIQDGTLFYVEDDFGRLHTNFTVLKKVLRNEYVRIDGDEVCELDIPNSQPTFLSILLKERGFDKQYPLEYSFYKSCVKDGIIYDMLASELNISRDEAKKKLFYILFGRNVWNSNCDKAFKKLFPEVFQWMVVEKDVMKDHRTIAHQLQKKESRLVFDNIIYRLKNEIPDIKLFTVHDSILFPKKYHSQVSEIFYNQVDSLFG